LKSFNKYTGTYIRVDICACIIVRKMGKIKIGEAVNAVGLKGEIRVYSYSEDSHIFEKIESVILDDETFEIQKARSSKGTFILKLRGIDGRDAAEAVKGTPVFVMEEQLGRLPEGTYYADDLLGSEVLDTDGRRLGVLRNITGNAAQYVFHVEDDSGKEFMVPAVEEFFKGADIEKKTICLKIIEGMI